MSTRVSRKLRRPCPRNTRRWFRQFLVICRCLDKGGGGGRHPVDRGVWTAKTVKRPRQQPAHPQYANYWALLTRKRHTMPHAAQPQHTNYWAQRTQKRYQREHWLQRPTGCSDPTHHAKGRTGDCPGPRKGTTTRRNVTWGGCILGRCCAGQEAGSDHSAQCWPMRPARIRDRGPCGALSPGDQWSTAFLTTRTIAARTPCAVPITPTDILWSLSDTCQHSACDPMPSIVIARG